MSEKPKMCKDNIEFVEGVRCGSDHNTSCPFMKWNECQELSVLVMGEKHCITNNTGIYRYKTQWIQCTTENTKVGETVYYRRQEDVVRIVKAVGLKLDSEENCYVEAPGAHYDTSGYISNYHKKVEVE